jgi:quinol monooxygenase YgiN
MTSNLALWVPLEAKPGKEKELDDVLKSALPLAESEPGTMSWYVVKIGPTHFGTFDTFADEGGRGAHLGGQIAKALFAKAPDLLAKAPKIEKLDVLVVKQAKK